MQSGGSACHERCIAIARPREAPASERISLENSQICSLREVSYMPASAWEIPSMPRATAFAVLLAFALPHFLLAGGPRLVAGSTYFDPAVMGQPIRWSSGHVSYYVDQGPLSAAVSHSQAVAMVDAAAALWSAVPTAAVTLVDAGTLNEDVSGLNAVAANGSLIQPADVAASATGYPIGVILDADGSVIDGLFGSGSSDPASCDTAGVVVITDNIHTNA